MSTNNDAEDQAEVIPEVENDEALEPDQDADEEGLGKDKIRGIVEAVLMTSNSPVTPGKLQALMKEVNGRDLREAVDALNESYAQGGHAMVITEVAGGFQVVTRKDYGPWVRKFHDHSHVRLSQAALETLSIIAFKQPVTRIEVDSVRGVDSGGVLRTLMELNMIRIVGRSEGVGRPMLFGTTRDFMAHFGLRSLADLPKPKELDELLAEGERKAHLAAEEGAQVPDDGLPAEGDPEATDTEPQKDDDHEWQEDKPSDLDEPEVEDAHVETPIENPEAEEPGEESGGESDEESIEESGEGVAESGSDESVDQSAEQ